MVSGKREGEAEEDEAALEVDTAGLSFSPADKKGPTIRSGRKKDDTVTSQARQIRQQMRDELI